MKLELEPNATPSPFVAANLSNNGSGDDSLQQMNETLKAGIIAAKEGKRDEARQLLLRVTEHQTDNETAWLWLASISEYPEELLVFLNNVLNINPGNERALEWTKATKSLLAKTFVQRGITASRENQKEFAVQCFNQALGHDSENELAWLWLASVSDSPEEKITHLQKVLWLNPENETAQASLASVKQQSAQSILKKANVAAISGEHATARQLLDELMEIAPEMEEAWILKAYLADSQDEKILCFEKVLAFNPENETARSGIDSLNALRERELERMARKLELEALQNAAFSEPAIEPPAPNFEIEEEPEVFFTETPETVAEPQQFADNYNVFDYTEDDDIHKTTTADKSQPGTEFMQDGPTQELEGEFVKTLEVLAAFSSETQTPADENAPQMSEDFAAETEFYHENGETDSTFAAPTEVEVFASAPEMITEMTADEEPAAESKDFQMMESQETFLKEENSYFETILARSDDAPPTVIDEETSWQPSHFSYSQDFEQNSSEEAQSEPDEDESLMTESFAYNTEPQPESYHAQNELPQFDSMSESETEHVAETIFTEPETFSAAVSEEENAVYEIEADENDSVESFFQAPSETEETLFQAAPETPEETHSEEILSAIEETHSEKTQPAAEEVFTEQPFDERETLIFSHKPHASAAPFACPFCTFINEPQSFMCPSCHSVLSLSELEMLLSNQEADRNYLKPAVERMENEMKTRSFSPDEMVFLGIAHLNLKNLRQGFTYLLDASRMNQNNVVLGSQVNSLAIRLVEIEQQESKNQESKCRTILVVDDSATVRKLISGKLEKCGHTVLVAVDGMDALAKVNEVIPDLILLDITMPRMDGYQVCKLIRNNNLTKDVPVVMISGKDGFFDKVRGRMAGSTGYITKPFGPDTLMRTIEAYLN